MAFKETSTKGDNFIIDREGLITRAYRDSGGVITIGIGFTMLSKTFAKYWRKTRGHALRMGDVIPKAEALKIFHSVINSEYVPPVLANIGPKEQHHLDGATSVSFNAGPASTKWKWARALKAGKIKECVRLLAVTAITVGGGKRVVQGLKNRRAAECRLIEFADYGSATATSSATTTEGRSRPAAVSSTPSEIKEYQRDLKKLGYYKGDIDGIRGSLTKGAVENFQRANGLKVDGIVGPATRATIARALAVKTQNQTTVGVGPVAAGGSGFGFHIENIWTLVFIGGGAILALVILFWIWNNRGVILRKRTPA